MKFQCPICRQPLHPHQESQGWYCDAKHHFDRHQKGYWNFFGNKKPKNAESRQSLRARQFLLQGGSFAPAIEALASFVAANAPDLAQSQEPIQAEQVLNCINFGAGNAWLGKALKESLSGMSVNVDVFSPLESENEAYAAAKSGLAGVCLTGHKSLPFASEAADMIWVLDTQPKGTEWQRVLRQGGFAVILAPGPRHLWQLKEFVYPELAEKPFMYELPKTFELIATESVSWTVSLDIDSILVLLDMVPWGWRAKDAERKAIATGDFRALELDYQLLLARKR